MPTARLAAAVEGEDAPLVKLHANHGKPCANPACRQPLVTGKIRGVICNLHRCKRWHDAAGIKKSYTTKKALAAVDENVHPQQAWADCARSNIAAQPKPRPPRQPAKLVSFQDAKVLGTCFAEALDRDDLEPETVMYYVSGRFRAGSHERVQSRWMTADDLDYQRRMAGRKDTVSFWASLHWEGPNQLEEAEEASEDWHEDEA